MTKAVFFDFYKTLCVWGQPLETSLQKIAERYRFEINWKRYATARENLYADASDSDPAANIPFSEQCEEIIESYYEFV